MITVPVGAVDAGVENRIPSLSAEYPSMFNALIFTVYVAPGVNPCCSPLMISFEI